MKNKKRNSCIITRLWPSVEDMKKDLFIDLEKQEVTRLSTGNKLTPYLSDLYRPIEKRHYVISYFNKKKHSLLLHRLFFYWHNGYLPNLVDHKDTNPQNNKIENLRELDNSGNTRNAPKYKNIKASSKYKGVSWSKRHSKWRVVIYLNGKQIYIGLYESEDDAGQAYNDKVRELGLEEVSVLNDTPQERARKINLFNEEKEPSYS